MGKITQEQLNKLLWNAANSARGTIDAGLFKYYILELMFYKYISDLKKYFEITLFSYNCNYNLINVPKGTSFYDIFAIIDHDDIDEIINSALHQIENANTPMLKNIFTADFTSQAILGPKDQRNKMIRHLMSDFIKINFAEVDYDLLGNAYMFLIERFASDAGKKSGEFYTPLFLSSLMVKLIQPKSGDSICDPTCGSGGLLLAASQELKKHGITDYTLFGQEKIGTTFNLARMNMFLHGEQSARIEWGDTLNNPLLLENNHLMLFDIVLANPPFSLDKWGKADLEYDIYHRFERGLPPSSKGDYAFISHILSTIKPKSGKAAVVVSRGVLFRGSSEGLIRQAIIEENILDAVICLPENLFLNIDIPVAILIFDKSRELGGANEKRKDVLFIDASHNAIHVKNQNILSEEDISKIIDTYKKRVETEGYSHLATFEEIKRNDFNLNLPRYINTTQAEEHIDFLQLNQEINKIETQLQKIQRKMQQCLQHLQIS